MCDMLPVLALKVKGQGHISPKSNNFYGSSCMYQYTSISSSFFQRGQTDTQTHIRAHTHTEGKEYLLG